MHYFETYLAHESDDLTNTLGAIPHHVVIVCIHPLLPDSLPLLLQSQLGLACPTPSSLAGYVVGLTRSCSLSD